jgi:acyl carrier protein
MLSIKEIRTKLEGYPEYLFEQYEQFLQNKDPENLNCFVIGLLQFLQDPTEDSQPASGDTNLREGLGVDSITIAEVIFQLEDIFEIEIENQDLAQIHTVDELKSYIISKLA